MRSGLAGAAIAAVMTCAGWVTDAEAEVISFSFSDAYDTTQYFIYGSFSGSLRLGSPQGGFVSYSYNAIPYVNGVQHPENTITQNFAGYVNNFIFTLNQTDNDYIYLINYQDFNLSLDFYKQNGGLSFQDGSATLLPNSGDPLPLTGFAFVTPNPVPLPPSVYLFGAALVAFGIASHAHRRLSRIAA